MENVTISKKGQAIEIDKPIITRVVKRAEKYMKKGMKYQEAIKQAEIDIFNEDMKKKG